MNQIIEDKVKLLPDSPGVYKMLDETGTVIYVGKAISLKNRVSQYFQKNKEHTPKVTAMVSHVADFETIGVHNEAEALSLESNLIKEFMPKYNILLKDDKHFPYVRIDLRKDFPRVEVVRRIHSDGATYLGPYLSAVALQEQLSIIRNQFPIRHCKKDLQKSIARRERPCLMYHIGKCCAPCSGKISREQYHAYLKDVISFLEGHTEQVEASLKKQMWEASDKLDFEQAALIRNRLQTVEKLQNHQAAIFPKEYEADVYAPARLEEDTLVYALFVRSGKIIGTEHYAMQARPEDTEEDILTAFLMQQYARPDNRPPKEILLPFLPTDKDAIADILSQRAGRRVYLLCPQRGDKVRLIEMAQKNGHELLEKEKSLREKAWDRDEGALANLSVLLGLEEIPTRMECFDNSHIMGTDTVSSMVVFTNGKPDKSAYRRFRIRSEAGGDDLISMEEVLTRRLEKGAPYPDLLIIDGGKTQLAIAEKVLQKLELPFIPVIALAEMHEWVYTPESDAPIILPRNSAPLHLLERIRDEAHRFAITYHRTVRQKNALFSRLDEIPGIGDKRKRALFDTFVTIHAIETASVEELSAVKGMCTPAAKAVYAYFHKGTASTDTPVKQS